MTHTVPVVVPSRNSARTMAACLASVRAQRGVVVVGVGVGTSEADRICRIDSDMVLTRDTLAGAPAEAHRSGVRTVAIGDTSVDGDFWTACRALEQRCYLDDRLRSARGRAARGSVR